MTHYNVAFLTKLIPEQLREEVDRLSTDNLQEAASALEWNLYHGLCDNTNQPIRIFNILPLGSYPCYYKRPFVRSSRFSTPLCSDNANIGFCNVRMIRKYSQTLHTYRALKKWCRGHEGEKLLFVYTICSEFMSVISKLKRKFNHLTVCAIVADLPNMASLASDQNRILRRYISVRAKESYARLNNIDCFVLLTEQMAPYMRINQPYCVVEGIAPETEGNPAYNNEEDRGIKTIFYSGTLHKQFGIMNLLEAFSGIDKKNYRLVVCGIGDAQDEIAAAVAKDDRIRYLGQLPREKVLQMQGSATVLVNPRQNVGEYVKYSFPSKNLEYLQSGRPLVAYKLDGIPDEYDDYIFYVRDNSVSALREKLTEVCENSETDGVLGKCSAAKVFIKEHKNAKVQTAVIIDMLEAKGLFICHEKNADCKKV